MIPELPANRRKPSYRCCSGHRWTGSRLTDWRMVVRRNWRSSGCCWVTGRRVTRMKTKRTTMVTNDSMKMTRMKKKRMTMMMRKPSMKRMTGWMMNWSWKTVWIAGLHSRMPP